MFDYVFDTFHVSNNFCLKCRLFIFCHILDSILELWKTCLPVGVLWTVCSVFFSKHNERKDFHHFVFSKNICHTKKYLYDGGGK